jgi:hypothetical protein
MFHRKVARKEGKARRVPKRVKAKKELNSHLKKKKQRQN